MAANGGGIPTDFHQSYHRFQSSILVVQVKGTHDLRGVGGGRGGILTGPG